ncbi:MAG: hypothetical protein J6K46_00295 [Sutterella sp.]|nr:hypothetical protein [Sutterella sp.]
MCDFLIGRSPGKNRKSAAARHVGFDAETLDGKPDFRQEIFDFIVVEAASAGAPDRIAEPGHEFAEEAFDADGQQD